MIKRHIWVLAIGFLAVGACGGDSDGDGADDPSATDVVSTEGADASAATAAEDLEAAVDEVDDAAADAEADAVADAEAAVDEIVDDLEAAQESVGGGGATFSADGQTWEFPSVLCAFGEDEIGQAGAVFNLSAIADGLQLYASIDDSGAAHSLSLNDIEDFENPSVSLSIDTFVAGMIDAPTEFLTLDGKSVSANVIMLDDITSLSTNAPAELSATCP